MSSKEEELYLPVMKLLETMFAEVGECHLEISASGISEGMKKHLDDPAINILQTESKKPDIFGYILAEKSYFKRRIVVEIKKGHLTIDDVYQVKKYAEILDAYYAFLISPKGFKEIYRRFLLQRHAPLSISGYQPIIIMRFTGDTLERDEELCYSDPFAPRYT